MGIQNWSWFAWNMVNRINSSREATALYYEDIGNQYVE